MSRAARMADRAQRLNREALAEARNSPFLYALSIGGITAWAFVDGIGSPRQWAVLINAALLAPLALFLLRLNKRRPWLVSTCLVILAFVDVSFCYAFLGLQAAAPLYTLPVLLAATLLHPAAAIPAAVAALAIVRAPSAPPPPGVELTVILVAAAAALLQWPGYSFMGWAWRSAARATQLAEQLRNRQGELNRLVQALDLTNRLLQRTNHELALARREAEEQRQLKEEFARNISHEMRTPLNIILGFSEIMYRTPEVYGDFAWPPTLRRDIAEIRRSARYLSDFVDDILDLARVESAQLPLRREPTDIGAIVEEAAEVGRRLLAEKRVQLLVQLPAGLPPVPVDRVRIRQVLINLLANAARYTEQGHIRVSAAQKGSELVISVSDTGAGIPPDQLETIFDEFRQVDAWRPAALEGKGLGLAIARRFVQAHGGRIWAESELGRGSTFYFSLPLERKDFSRLRQTSAAPLPTNPYANTVVLLGSEASVAYLARHVEGFRFILARTPEELSQRVSELHPAAVVAEEGLEIPEEALPPGVPLVSCQLPRHGDAGTLAGFAARLNKPVEQEQLLAMLSRFLPQGGEVLVVDDDRAFVQLILRMLEAQGNGYRARYAYGGEEALRKMRERPPSLVLLDLVMPGLDGFAVLRAMQAEQALARVPVVAVTGISTEERARAKRHSFAVRKRAGLRERELLALLRAVLEAVQAEYA